jgi:transcriptional regulator with XRE-family HTH domain
MSRDDDRELADFASRLRSAREASGLTQQAACEAMGVSPTQMSNWERGKSSPHLEDLARVARFLGVSAHWMLFGEGPRTADLLPLAEVSSPEASPQALAAALERMPSDELFRIAEAKRTQELAAWNEPIQRSLDALREALSANPPLHIRDEINRSIERLRRDLRGEREGEEAKRAVRYHSGPVQREGYVEERSVDYERKDDDDEDRPAQRKKG